MRSRHPLIWHAGVKIAGALVVLWIAATLTFVAMYSMPGDPALAVLGGPGANPTAEAIAEVTERYGFDDPFLAQYADHLGRLAQGDLGTSYSLKQPVTQVISGQVWDTVALAAAALVVAWALAILSSLLTVRRGRVRTSLGSGAEILAASLPQFWLGIMLLVVFGFELGWFPIAAGGGAWALVLPTLTLAIPLAGYLAQVTRDGFDIALDEPFTVSARARGMSERGVRVRHALRHALLPGITLSGWAVGSLFSAAVVVEYVFARPGIGRTLVQAVGARDMPLVIGITLLVAVIYVLANLVIDALYPVVDPRLRARRATAARAATQPADGTVIS